jgi:hypothetical protein
VIDVEERMQHMEALLAEDEEMMASAWWKLQQGLGFAKAVDELNEDELAQVAEKLHDIFRDVAEDEEFKGFPYGDTELKKIIAQKVEQAVK